MFGFWGAMTRGLGVHAKKNALAALAFYLKPVDETELKLRKKYARGTARRHVRRRRRLERHARALCIRNGAYHQSGW